MVLAAVTAIQPEACSTGAENKKILDQVRANNFKDVITCCKGLDQELVKGAVAGPKFKELFFANCKDEAIKAYVETLL